MAKPPPGINVGAVTTSSAGGNSAFNRAAPAVDPNPDTNPLVASVIAGAHVQTVEAKPAEAKPQAQVRAAAPASRRPSAVQTPVATERFVPKFSLGGDVVDALDEMVRRARCKSGDEVTLSRVVSAALMELAELNDSDLVAAIRKIPVRARGRKPATRK